MNEIDEEIEREVGAKTGIVVVGGTEIEGSENLVPDPDQGLNGIETDDDPADPEVTRGKSKRNI